MKLLTFVLKEEIRYGSVVDGGVVDLQEHLGSLYSDLKSLLADPSGLQRARDIENRSGPRISLEEIRFAPVIPTPGQIFCIGLNYHAHRIESERDETEQPTVFLRLPGSQQGHREALVRPKESNKFDFEGEIAVVIGAGGRRIAAADAWRHVAGYSCYNDGSVRDWQRHTSQWTAGKNFARTGGFGPWLVTADEISAGSVMSLVSRLNGQEMQRTTTDLMIHSIPKQIAYLSTFIDLSAGDVIVTGTPGGVGVRREPPVFMKPGDAVEVEVEGVGLLTNSIVDG
jgi:2-keto-4-pentenoate hydratase/2-oxohepta-3-ene-1,7-dioic acid hydratase in catechol pathway